MSEIFKYAEAMSWKAGDKIVIVTTKGNIYHTYFVTEHGHVIIGTDDEVGTNVSKFIKSYLDFEKTKLANKKEDNAS